MPLVPRVAALAALALLVLLAAPGAGAGAMQATLTVANALPYVAGGNAERTPLGEWRLWIDSGDANGAEDLVAAEAVLVGHEGPRVVPLQGPARVGDHARFEAEVPAEEGLQWTAIRLRDAGGAAVEVALPRAAPLSPAPPLVASTSAVAPLEGGLVLVAIALLAAVPGVLIQVHRRRL